MSPVKYRTETRQGKSRQTKQDKARQVETKQDKTNKTSRDKARQDKTRQDKARQVEKDKKDKVVCCHTKPDCGELSSRG